MEKTITYFLYVRKSTDEADRQILSLESQREEAIKRFGNLKIIKLPPESVSAFDPEKRPIFNEMIGRIKKGEAQGIIAWHPDRLSRNPIDAAQIIRSLDMGILKDLKFCNYYFDNSPEGKMMLAMTLSQSKYSSDKLSKDVKRGMNKKAQAGWRPGLAPLGYKNSKTNLKGEQVVYNDLQRFNLVKQVWQLMLTGNYTVPDIFEIVNNEWKLTQPGTRKRPERKLHLSKMYRIFTTPFYYGWYLWGGEWIKGNHEPMITAEEFDRVQFLLGRNGRPRPKTHIFAFTGLIRCGSCDAMVTAHEKWKYQKNGKVHHYIYYHCSKRKKVGCTEKYLELAEFEQQVDKAIAGFAIPEKFKDYAIKYLHEIRKNEARAHEDVIVMKHRRLEGVIKQIDNVVLTYTSPENINHQLMTEEECVRLKANLIKEKNQLETDLNVTGQKIEEWVELTEKTFKFARYARMWFDNPDLKVKKTIFSCFGWNLLLKDKKVGIELKKPFTIVYEGLLKAQEELGRLEPVKIPQNEAKFKEFVTEFPVLSG